MAFVLRSIISFRIQRSSDEGHEGHTFIITVYIDERRSIQNIRKNMNNHITSFICTYYIIMDE
jgi:RNA binding exosome subunit